MGRMCFLPFSTMSLCLWFLISALPASKAQLTPNFYLKTCPNLETIVLTGMKQAVQKEARLAASILRLFFHDCFVQGCDGSLLLDDTTNFQGEKTAKPNNQSVRGFEVIDNIKAQVEAQCKGVVSCADILAIAARDGVVLSNGPTWSVLLGRRDSRTASLTLANNNIPSPLLTVSQLISKFQAQGLSVQDMVALSGGHTIGQARCLTFRQRLYNQSGTGQPDPTLDKAYLAQLQRACPSTGGDTNLSPLDLVTPTRFDNQYFVNLQNHKGLLNSDEVLFSTTGSSTIATVTTYAGNPTAFFHDFTTSMVNMGNINPLTGTSGEIRSNCRLRN